MLNRKKLLVSKRWIFKYAIVALEGGPIVVLQPENDHFLAATAHDWREVTVKYEDVHPYPIDTYILIRLGFQGSKEGKTIYYSISIGNTTIALTRNKHRAGEWILTIDDEATMSISYVHVLQNVVSLLANIFIVISKKAKSLDYDDFDEDKF